MHVTNTVRFMNHPQMRLRDDEPGNASTRVWSLSALLDQSAIRRDLVVGRLRALAAAVMRVADVADIAAGQIERGGSVAWPPKLLGLDVLLDAEHRPWLLEVERYPALSGGAAPAATRVNERLMSDTA